MKTIKWKGKKFSINRLWCYKNPFFGYGTRKLKTVKGIVIHNTGNKNDTAKANANYFLNNKKRYGGAHIVIDRNGIIYQCARLKDICFSVGGDKYKNTTPKYYNILNNVNTISIELCDIVDKEPSKKQIESTIAVISYIQKHCKNAKTICRHYDINGKPCPIYFIEETRWSKLLKTLKLNLK